MAPTGLFDRLKAYYSKAQAPKPPALSTWSAAALSAIFVLLYVLPFYLSKTTRPSPTLSRDAPSVIRARIRAVTLACIVSTAATLYILLQPAKRSLAEALHLLGWWPIDLLAVAKTLLLCMVLFTGPLFESGIAYGNWKSWVRLQHVRETLSSSIGYRNLVAGPVTEEIVFRSLLIPLHLLTTMSPKRIIFVTPLYFGIAHVHHYYEFRLTHPDTPALPAVLRSVVQFTYTSLFGFFAAFVYLRTGNIFAVIIAHSFCNWAGLPRFWGSIRVEAGEPIGPPVTATKKSDVKAGEGSRGGSPAGNHLPWTVVYYLLLVAGAVGFYYQLWPLTESGNALATIGVAKKAKWEVKI